MRRLTKPINLVLLLVALGVVGTWTLFIIGKVTSDGRYIHRAFVCFGITLVVAFTPLGAGLALRLIQRVRGSKQGGSGGGR